MSSCRRGEGNLEGIHESAGDGQVGVRHGAAAPRSAVSSPSRGRRMDAGGRGETLRARLIEAAVELLAGSSVPRLGWTGVTGLLA